MNMIAAEIFLCQIEPMEARPHMSDVETPSGKGAADENFPVGSFLLPKKLRPHVAKFYAFARAIDDIADNPDLTADDKINRLDACGQALTQGSDDPALITSTCLYHSLRESNVTPQHGLDLIDAFKQDAVKSRYKDWDELIDYCRRSAAPVGRYLLDLHGEDKALYPASDALCHALQVINHIQDACDDRRDMDRVYVPTDWLAEENIDVRALDGQETSPELRRVFNKMLIGTQELLDVSRRLAPSMQSRHLSSETRIIQKLAEVLVKKLSEQDPIATRVVLSKPAMLFVAVCGLLRI